MNNTEWFTANIKRFGCLLAFGVSAFKWFIVLRKNWKWHLLAQTKSISTIVNYFVIQDLTRPHIKKFYKTKEIIILKLKRAPGNLNRKLRKCARWPMRWTDHIVLLFWNWKHKKWSFKNQFESNFSEFVVSLCKSEKHENTTWNDGKLLTSGRS